VGQWWQPQPEPQTPPDLGALGAGEAPAPDDDPTFANTESRRTESTWPDGQAAGALDSLMGRRSSNASSQVRQRYS
jgi:hypothetical protein